LDWASWDLSDLQGRQAQIQLVDRALTDWGLLIADYFTLAAQPAQSAAQRVRWIDYGNDYYAAVTFNNVPRNERLMVGWMGNWDYAQTTPTGTWRGQQSILRKLTLQNVNGKPTLIQTPVDYGKLFRSTTTVKPFQVTNGTRTLAVSGQALQIDATLTPSTATDFGIDVRVGNGQKTRIGYNTTTQQLYVDRTNSGNTAFSAAFSGIHSAPLKLNGCALKLQIFVDTSSVEVFANGGRISISDLIYPDPSSQGVQIFGNGGAAKATSLTIKTLKPAISR
jgi:levanase